MLNGGTHRWEIRDLKAASSKQVGEAERLPQLYNCEIVRKKNKVHSTTCFNGCVWFDWSLGARHRAGS